MLSSNIKFEQISQWSNNKGYLKLLIVKVDKQLITKVMIPQIDIKTNNFNRDLPKLIK